VGFFNGLGRTDRSLGVDSKWVVIDDGFPMSQLDAQIKPIMIVLSLSLLPPSRRDDIASSHTGVKHGNTPGYQQYHPFGVCFGSDQRNLWVMVNPLGEQRLQSRQAKHRSWYEECNLVSPSPSGRGTG